MARQMKAVLYEEFGGTDKIITGAVGVPEVKGGKVLVKTKPSESELFII